MKGFNYPIQLPSRKCHRIAIVFERAFPRIDGWWLHDELFLDSRPLSASQIRALNLVTPKATP